MNKALFYGLRHCDALGRFPVPAKISREFRLDGGGNFVEIFVDGDTIIFQKWTNKKCVFCRTEKDLLVFKEKYLCQSCKEVILSRR